MTLRQYLIIMGVSSLLCWGAWIFLLFTIDPFETTPVGFAFFYVSLFFALVGTISLKSFFIHSLINKEAPLFRLVKAGFRDGFFLAGALVFLLYLQSLHLLTFWNTGIFVIFILLFATFSFLANKNQASV